MFLPSCATAPITQRRQLKIISEVKLNAQAAATYEKVKKKEKMSNDKKSLSNIKKIGSKMEAAISEYFDQSNIADPTINFDWFFLIFLLYYLWLQILQPSYLF